MAEKLLLDDRSGPIPEQTQPLNMLLCTEGKELSLSEFAVSWRILVSRASKAAGPAPRSMPYWRVNQSDLMSEIVIEKVLYQGWPNCYRITNGAVELIVTSDIGPRIMRYGFTGGQNFFAEFAGHLGASGEAQWVARGGHRLWVAPEDPIKTYATDNAGVRINVNGAVLTATQPVEELSGMLKQIQLEIAEDGGVVVTHRIANHGETTVEMAPWALSMMAPGGTGIHGFPPRGTHPEDLNPTNPLVMSAYTDFSDPRWKFTRKYLILRQDPHATSPQKAGSFNNRTFGAYALGSELFIKRTTAPGAPREYPDFGCSFETFTNADFLELETLGPVKRLAPGEIVEHVERWSLHAGVQFTEWTDAELDRLLLPLLD